MADNFFSALLLLIAFVVVKTTTGDTACYRPGDPSMGPDSVVGGRYNRSLTASGRLCAPWLDAARWLYRGLIGKESWDGVRPLVHELQQGRECRAEPLSLPLVSSNRAGLVRSHPLLPHPGWRRGPWCYVRVAKHGPGVPDESLPSNWEEKYDLWPGTKHAVMAVYLPEPCLPTCPKK